MYLSLSKSTQKLLTKVLTRNCHGGAGPDPSEYDPDDPCRRMISGCIRDEELPLAACPVPMADFE